MPAARANSLRRALYRRIGSRRVALRDRRFHTVLRNEPSAAALLLSPHWDDAVLDCWSLLAGEAELNVVNVFAGSPPSGRLTLWDAITGAADSAQRTHERRAEDAVALARANRQPVNLSLLDNQYRSKPGPALEQLDSALAAEVSSASRVYVPAGLGAHPDHLHVRRYGQALARTGMPVTLYADLPYCVAHGWPYWVDGSEPEPNRNVDAFWLSFMQGIVGLPPLRSARVVRLDEQDSQAKLAAMACYATQFPTLNGGAKQMLADPAMHGFELQWDLQVDA